ncbi:MAG: S26 family signal peptidase [Novosphingobium sp.]
MPEPRPGNYPGTVSAFTPAEVSGKRTARRYLLVTGVLGIALIGVGGWIDLSIQPAPRLVWNASVSAPVGLWRIHPGVRLRTGDMVLARTPASVRSLAAARRYVPANVPLVKRIAARDGDEVCAIGAMVFVNGRPVAKRLAHDSRSRPLPWWSGCEALRDGRLLLLMDNPASFDGRYFGPVDEDAIIGKATPLWLR